MRSCNFPLFAANVNELFQQIYVKLDNSISKLNSVLYSSNFFVAMDENDMQFVSSNFPVETPFKIKKQFSFVDELPNDLTKRLD